MMASDSVNEACETATLASPFASVSSDSASGHVFIEGFTCHICARCQHLGRSARGSAWVRLQSACASCCFTTQSRWLYGAVHMWSGGKAVSELRLVCAVPSAALAYVNLCSECCLGTPTHGRRLAPVDVLLGFSSLCSAVATAPVPLGAALP